MAVAALLLADGCSLGAYGRREASLRQALDAHQFGRPCQEVWPTALRLLDERGCDLVGRDRAAVGKPGDPWWRHLVGSGFETRRASDGGLLMESRRNSTGIRYRLEGKDETRESCRVRFFAIRQTGEAPEERSSRDLALELVLVRQLEPMAATRIDAAVDSAGR